MGHMNTLQAMNISFVTNFLSLFGIRILPLVIVVTVFGSLAGTTHIVEAANACSCWCSPHLGNVLPFSLGRDEVGC